MKMIKTFTALQHPNYRLWFWGQLISLFGTWMQITAQSFLVFALTRSPAYLGYVSFLAFPHGYLCCTGGGLIADRVHRRTPLTIAQCSMMMLALVPAKVTFAGIVQPWHIVVFVLGLGLANAFDAPARQAFVIELVDREDITNAVALNSTLFEAVYLPLLLSGLVGLGYCIYLYFAQRSEEEGDVTIANPFELGPALKFGLIYAGILLISKTALLYLGDTGIFASSILAGLADVDAITLSVARLSQAGGSLEISTASQAVILAAMSNTIAKGVLVIASGSRGLRKSILPAVLLILATGLGVGFIF